jgi:hypothetical protein
MTETEDQTTLDESILDHTLKCQSTHTHGWNRVCSVDVTVIQVRGCDNDRIYVCANHAASIILRAESVSPTYICDQCDAPFKGHFTHIPI